MNTELVNLYGTDKIEDILKSKTSDTQVRAFNGSPGKVKLSAEQCKKMCDESHNKLQYLEGYENRVRKYVITDETVDRYGDIVRAGGCEYKNYINNPVVLFAHDQDSLPVGNSIKLKKTGNAVESIALFFDDRVDPTGRSDTIFRFVQANALRAVSIGFVPLEYTVPKSKDERDKLGLGDYGVEFKKWDLMEFSVVPVPANPFALTNSYMDNDQLRKAIKDGLFEKKNVDCLRKYPIVGEDAIDILIKEVDKKTQIVKTKTIDEIIARSEGMKKDKADNVDNVDSIDNPVGENQIEGKDGKDVAIEQKSTESVPDVPPIQQDVDLEPKETETKNIVINNNIDIKSLMDVMEEIKTVVTNVNKRIDALEDLSEKLQIKAVRSEKEIKRIDFYNDYLK